MASVTVCLCVSAALKENGLSYELQTIWYTMYSMTGPRHALTKVEGQGHRAMKCAADVGMRVDMTA